MKPRCIQFWTQLLVLATVLSIAASCSPRKVMVNEFVGMLEDGLPAIEQEDDLNLLARALPAHIKLLETMLASDPRNERLLNLLARIYGGYAFALLESEWEARSLDAPSVVDTGYAEDQLAGAVARYYQTGADYALRSLAVRHPRARDQLNQLSRSADFIRSLDGRDVPALFWYGFNLGGAIRHQLDSVAAMAKAHLVEKAMARVVALNPGYDNGNAYLVLMVYHASRPRMMGGNPEKARYYLRQYRKIHGAAASLGDVFMARYLLVEQQERAAFIKLLAAVPQPSDGRRPFTLMDRVAAVRAKTYLEASDRFFN
jgi:hypothetical protein